MLYRPTKSHPWKRVRNHAILGTSPMFRSIEPQQHKFFARDTDGTVFSFQKQKSRNEWVLGGEGRVAVFKHDMDEVALLKVVPFDSDAERLLYDANRQRKWKEKRVKNER